MHLSTHASVAWKVLVGNISFQTSLCTGRPLAVGSHHAQCMFWLGPGAHESHPEHPPLSSTHCFSTDSLLSLTATMLAALTQWSHHLHPCPWEYHTSNTAEQSIPWCLSLNAWPQLLSSTPTLLHAHTPPPTQTHQKTTSYPAIIKYEGGSLL